MPTKRRGLPRSLRFEVFKRDSFTCQYCGARAPEVVLEADHVVPVAKGGTDDLLNLVTACENCNGGKSDRELSDSSVLQKQHAQLAALQERREQLEMMMEWQRELAGLQDYALDQLASYWSEVVPGYALNDSGRRQLKRLSKNFAADELMHGMREAVDYYGHYEDGRLTNASVEHAWQKVGGVCRVARGKKEKPYLSDILYIRGILRNRIAYCPQREALNYLDEAAAAGASIDHLRRLALEAKNWTRWRNAMLDLLEWLNSN